MMALSSRIETLQQLAEDGISTAACDVTSAASIAACVAEVTKQAGAIDVLINNAGKLPLLSCSLDQLSVDQSRTQVQTSTL